MDAKLLAEIAYRAFCDWMAWKTSRGTPLPAWDQLSVSQQNAWTAASSAVAVAIRREVPTPG